MTEISSPESGLSYISEMMGIPPEALTTWEFPGLEGECFHYVERLRGGLGYLVDRDGSILTQTFWDTDEQIAEAWRSGKRLSAEELAEVQASRHRQYDTNRPRPWEQ